MIGEIGGPQESEAAKWVKENMTKPVVGYVAGLTAPKGRRMGHAGAIISAEGDSAAEKAQIMKSYGLFVAPSAAELGSTVALALAQGALKRAASRAARNPLTRGPAVRPVGRVVQRYEPQVAAVLREERTTAGMPASLLARTLQAQGIWFQLLAIAEQNRDMRNRREVERERGYRTIARYFRQRVRSCCGRGRHRAEDPAGILRTCACAR